MTTENSICDICAGNGCDICAGNGYYPPGYSVKCKACDGTGTEKLSEAMPEHFYINKYHLKNQIAVWPSKDPYVTTIAHTLDFSPKHTTKYIREDLQHSRDQETTLKSEAFYLLRGVMNEGQAWAHEAEEFLIKFGGIK